MYGPGFSGALNEPAASLGGPAAVPSGSSTPTSEPPSELAKLLEKPRTSPPDPTEFERLLKPKPPPPSPLQEFLEKPLRLPEVTVVGTAARLLGGAAVAVALLPSYLEFGEMLDDAATRSWLDRLEGAGNGSGGGNPDAPRSPSTTVGGDPADPITTITVTGRAPPAPPLVPPRFEDFDLFGPGLLSGSVALPEPAPETGPAPDLIDSLQPFPETRVDTRPVPAPKTKPLPDLLADPLAFPSPETAPLPKPKPAQPQPTLSPGGQPPATPPVVCTCHPAKTQAEKDKQKKKREKEKKLKEELGELEVEYKFRIGKLPVKLKLEGPVEHIRHRVGKRPPTVRGLISKAVRKGVGALLKKGK